MATFDCCFYCKPPERKPCCHINCEEYLIARDKYRSLKKAVQDAYFEQNTTSNDRKAAQAIRHRELSQMNSSDARTDAYARLKG